MKILEIAKANKGKVALIGVGALALTAAAILAIKKMTGGSDLGQTVLVNGQEYVIF